LFKLPVDHVLDRLGSIVLKHAFLFKQAV